MAMKLEVISYNPDGPSIVRDSRDRVYIGPITPPFGIKGREYYLNLANGAKVTADLAIELVNPFTDEAPAKPDTTAEKGERKCAQCGGPMPEGAHHKAKYCCERCKEMSKVDRKTDAVAENLGSKGSGGDE